jgi:type II secretory pathway pseudopilin PulG
MIVLILGAIAIVAVVTIIIMARFKSQRTTQLYSSSSYQANAIIARVAALVRSQNAWNNTLSAAQNATTFACLNAGTSCSGMAGSDPITLNFPLTAPVAASNFALYADDNSLYYDSTVATNGFDKAGAACSAFDSVSGNDNCPFHVVLYWIATCGATTPCNTYTVHGYVVYKPKNNYDATSGLGSMNYSLGYQLSNNNVKSVNGILRYGIGTKFYCCAINCLHNQGEPYGLAWATISIVNDANCYLGSPEIGNDFCDQAITNNGSTDASWGPDPATVPIVTPGICPQGAP